MLTVAAGVAQANQFIAKTGEIEEGEFKISGASGSENPQLFRIADMEIICTAGREQGTLIAPNETLEVQLQLKDCTTEVRDGVLTARAKVTVKNPLLLSYAAAAGGGTQAEGPITLEIKALSCEVTLSPHESGPTEYENESDSVTRLRKFPSGFQHKLKISAAVGFLATETTLGSCPGVETFGGSGESGPKLPVYEGTIFDEAKGADLGLEEGETLPEGWNKVKNVE